MTHPTRLFKHNDWRADAAAAVGEFLGTFVYLFFAFCGVQAARDGLNGASDNSTVFLLMAATSFGISLLFSAWIFYRITGAAFNPQVALMLCLLKAITPLRFAMYVLAQLLGAICAAAALSGLLPGDLQVNCAPSNGTSVVQALFLEMFLTFGLCICVAMIAVEKHTTTPLGPIAIGLALFGTQLAGIHYTGGAVNTARAFGPAVATATFVGSHWIYWVGPSLGAVLAALLYRVLHWIHYWELTPDVDATEMYNVSRPSAAMAKPDASIVV